MVQAKLIEYLAYYKEKWKGVHKLDMTKVYGLHRMTMV